MKSLLTILVICTLTNLAFSQNFGIDESNPTEKLHVNGNSLVTGNSYIGSTDAFFFRDAANRIATTSQFYVQAASTNTFLYSANTYLGNSGDLIHLRTNTFDWTSGGGGIINPSGDVGIGTITPAHKLDVVGNFNFTGVLFLNGSSGTANNVLISNGASAPSWQTVGNLMANLTAGTGISSTSYDGSTARTFNVVARNGITANTDDIELGGTLDETTTIAQGAFDMNYNLTGTGDFIVKIAGVNAMWVQEDGNTYIGESNAAANNLYIANDIIDWDNTAYDLDPNSVSHLNEIEADLGSATDPSYTFDGDANNGMFSPGADITAFTTAGVERVRISATGNVGIGTTAPAFKLDILGTTSNVNIESTSGQAYLVIDKPTAAGSAYVNFKVAGADGWVTGPYGGSAFRVIDWPNGGSANGALYIEQGGENRIGMGTIAPAALLDIQQTTFVTATNIIRVGTSADAQEFVVTSDGAVTADGNITTPGTIQGGDVIATGSDVYDNSGPIRLSGEDGVNITMDYNNTADGSTAIIFGKASQSAPTELMRIQESGLVGIGTAAPGYPLEVSGTVATGTIAASAVHVLATATAWTASNTASRTVSIKANGLIWATGGYISASDSRAKENIESMNSETSLDLINRLNVVKYNWIDKTKSNQKFEDGFIAQEIEKIMPEAVDKNREFIPNVYALAKNYQIEGDVLEVTLEKKAAIKKGDLIKLYTMEGREYRLNISNVKGNVCYMQLDEEAKKITGQLFVYGKQVDDFGTVNYDRVFTVGISAIQELSKQLDAVKAENASLKSENGNIKTSNEELTNRMNGLKAEIDLIKERLNMKAEK